MEVSNLGVSLSAGMLLCKAAKVVPSSSKCRLLLGTYMWKTEIPPREGRARTHKPRTGTVAGSKSSLHGVVPMCWY